MIILKFLVRIRFFRISNEPWNIPESGWIFTTWRTTSEQKLNRSKGHLISFFIGWSKYSWANEKKQQHKIHAPIQNWQKSNRSQRDLGLFFISTPALVCHCIIYNIVPLCMKPDTSTTIDVRLSAFCSCRSVFFVLSTVCVVSFAHLIPFSQINICVCVCSSVVWSISLPQFNLLLEFTHTNYKWALMSVQMNKTKSSMKHDLQFEASLSPLLSLTLYFLVPLHTDFVLSFFSMTFSIEWLKANLNANSKFE